MTTMNNNEKVQPDWDELIKNIESFKELGDLDTDEDMYNQGLERAVKEINKFRQVK